MIGDIIAGQEFASRHSQFWQFTENSRPHDVSTVVQLTVHIKASAARTKYKCIAADVHYAQFELGKTVMQRHRHVFV